MSCWRSSACWGLLRGAAQCVAAGAGKHSVGAGNAIAVQNLGENAAMLLMLALYSLVVKLGVPVVGVGVGFGVVFALAISVLWWSQRR